LIPGSSENKTPDFVSGQLFHYSLIN